MFGKLTYAPHKLYVKEKQKQFDEFGNYEGETETFTYLCDCRCDDAGVRDAISVRGEQFFPSYHIAMEKGVENGAFVRILDENGNIRGEGKIVRVAYSNYFKLYRAWI